MDDMRGPSISKVSIHLELERTRADFRAMVAGASSADLHDKTAGTRWTNEQLLFHMVLGYAVVRTLLPLVRGMARLPEPISRGFATMLDLAARPFHLVNFLGPCVGGQVVRGRRLIAQMDRIIASLDRTLDAETGDSLGLSMHFPVRWDPLFAETMTILDLYHYGTTHYDFHRRQLTLRSAR